jgi:hypothetical protein
LNQQPNLLIKKSIGPDCFKNKTNKMNQNRKNISEKERKKGRKEGKKEVNITLRPKTYKNTIRKLYPQNL